MIEANLLASSWSDVALAVLPALVAVLLASVLPLVLEKLRRQREEAALRESSARDFVGLVRSLDVARGRQFFEPVRANETRSGGTSVTPDRFAAISDLHRAEARLCHLVPEVAKLARSVTRAATKAVSGEDANEIPNLETDLLSILDLGCRKR
ncbi:hypothetical protein BH10ACT2_BH10ACT2_11380 [soil metagenome]